MTDGGGLGGGGNEPPKEPDELDGPNVAWFLAGSIERDRIENYILNPEHEIGGNKARVWKSAFGIEQGDGELLERLTPSPVA